MISTPARSHQTSSCSIAAARKVSAAATITLPRFCFEPRREFRDGGGFADAVDADQHDHQRRVAGIGGRAIRGRRGSRRSRALSASRIASGRLSLPELRAHARRQSSCSRRRRRRQRSALPRGPRRSRRSSRCRSARRGCARGSSRASCAVRVRFGPAREPAAVAALNGRRIGLDGSTARSARPFGRRPLRDRRRELEGRQRRLDLRRGFDSEMRSGATAAPCAGSTESGLR